MNDQLLNQIENIGTKGEIAYKEQFLLLSQCFQNAVCCRFFVGEKRLSLKLPDTAHMNFQKNFYAI